MQVNLQSLIAQLRPYQERDEEPPAELLMMLRQAVRERQLGPEGVQNMAPAGLQQEQPQYGPWREGYVAPPPARSRGEGGASVDMPGPLPELNIGRNAKDLARFGVELGGVPLGDPFDVVPRAGAALGRGAENVASMMGQTAALAGMMGPGPLRPTGMSWTPSVQPGITWFN